MKTIYQARIMEKLRFWEYARVERLKDAEVKIKRLREEVDMLVKYLDLRTEFQSPKYFKKRD